MSNPLDVLRAQALALQAQADAILLTLDQMQARPVAPEMPVPEPTRPATAPAADGATPASAAGAAPVSRRFPTFDGGVTLQAPASGAVEYAASRTIAPDPSGDLRPT